MDSKENITIIDVLNEANDDHYIEMFNANLNNIHDQFSISTDASKNYIYSTFNNNVYNSNSPVTLSNNNSDDDGDDTYYDSDQSVSNKHFRPLSYKKIEHMLDKYYNDYESKISNEFDILITYVKGQKNLYLLAKNLSQTRLHILLITSLFITGCSAILAPFIQDYYWNGAFISALNATTILLVSISNYFKLESTVVIFQYISKEYDKMEILLQMITSRFLYEQNEKPNFISDKLQEIEKQIIEIQGRNPLILPNEIIRLFPIICNINIFSFIKRMEIQKQILILRFKDVKNEIRYILYTLSIQTKNKDAVRLKHRLEYLLTVKDKLKEELVQCRTVYGNIDEVFTQEINYALKHEFHIFSSKNINHLTGNFVLDKYLKFILSK